METKQAVPSASACIESSFEMRLVAWGMLDELKNEVDMWMSQKNERGTSVMWSMALSEFRNFEILLKLRLFQTSFFIN